MGKSLKTSQRTIAAVSVASLALLNVGIMAPAHAAPGDETAAVISTKDMPNEVTLKIHKHEPDSNTKNSNPNGTVPKTLPAGRAIGGVTFTAYKVADIDLTTNEGWKQANAFTTKWNAADKATRDKAIADGSFALENGTAMTISKEPENVQSETTGVDGLASFTVSGTQRGLYVVQESISQSKVTVGGADNKISKDAVSQAAPFVVALPMTNQDETSEWLNEVNVYPKNNVTGITKAVQDEQTPGTGNDKSDIVYTIKTDVPQGVKKIDAYKIVDPLDSRLTYRTEAELAQNVDGSDRVLTVSLEGGDSTQLTGDDYTITTDEIDPPKPNPASEKESVGGANTISNYVTVTFTDTGLQKLVSSGATKVKWDLTANVGQTQGAADIENQAYLLPDNDAVSKWNNDKTPPENPSNTVVSKYGKFVLNKQDENGEALNGAVFELYTCSKDSTKADLTDGNKVTVDNQSSWTSGKTLGDQGQIVDGPKGQIVIDGLQLNDFKNGAEGTTVGEANEAGQVAYEEWKDKSFYCLVETKAPNGYELLPEPIKFQITQKTSSVEGSVDWTNVTSVKNVPNNGGFDLPLTGGKGIFGLIALGALLVLGSIGYIFFASRRQES